MIGAAVSLLFLQAASNPDLIGDVRFHKDFQSSILGNKRNLAVYLPPGYRDSKGRRYPVLYMHDGQNVFDPTKSAISHQEWRADETAQGLIDAGLIQPLIIVAIDNAGADRSEEYLPTRAKIGKGFAGGNVARYIRFLFEEVKPFVDKTYRTKQDRLNTGVAGSSLGGVATWEIGRAHPELVSKLGIFSPSLWWDDHLVLHEVQALPKHLPLKIWLDIGTKEGQEQIDNNAQFAQALTSKGWRVGSDLFPFVDYGAMHTETAWARRFGLMLMTLFPAKR